jgi:hypothetical protein
MPSQSPRQSWIVEAQPAGGKWNSESAAVPRNEAGKMALFERPCFTCSASTMRLTYRYAGRDFRLTDVHGKVVKAMLA